MPSYGVSILRRLFFLNAMTKLLIFFSEKCVIVRPAKGTVVIRGLLFIVLISWLIWPQD